MTSKEKVKQAYPGAFAMRFRTNGGKGYNLVYATRTGMPIGEGPTESKAWVNAAKKLKPVEATQ